MKKTAFFILVLSLILSALAMPLTSCSCMGGNGAGEVSVFYYTYSDTYISGVRGAMDRLLKEAGLKFNNYDANSSQSTQTDQIDTAIAKGSSLLVVNVVDTGSDDAAKTIISKAKAKDIPVIFFNRSVSEEVIRSYDKCLFIGTDYEEAGHMQGELIGNYLVNNFASVDINGDGTISYVLFKGQQGNLEAEARTKFAVSDANAILAKNGKAPLKFYDSKNSDGYLVDQGGNWSAQAAGDYMKTILSKNNEAGGNMVELVIANNDEMALGAIAALNEVGYNKAGGRVIPVFGIDATESAVSKINEGQMAGTIKQDGEGMAKAIVSVAKNLLGGVGMLEGIDPSILVGNYRINIPYSAYTKE